MPSDDRPPLFEPVGDHDWRLVAGATGLLGDLNRAGRARGRRRPRRRRVGDLGGEDDDAGAARRGARGARGAPRVGRASTSPRCPSWPPSCRGPSPAAGGRRRRARRSSRPARCRVEHGLLYLDRYHRLEQQVVRRPAGPRAASRRRPSTRPRWPRRSARIRAGHLSDEQRDAAVRGGAAVDDRDHRRARHRQDHHRRADAGAAGRPGRPRAASGSRSRSARRPARPRPGCRRRWRAELAALDRRRPRAASAGVEAMTLHRLLGWRADNATRFRHDRGNRLKYDVVVVDESSMVELTMMARLLEAVRPQARLVLVGDPRQLTSVGAGAVLSDLVAGYEGDPGLAGRLAHRELPVDRRHQGARRGAPPRRRRRGAGRAAGRRRPRSSSSRPTTPRARCAPTRSPPRSRCAGRPRPATRAAAVAALDEHRLLCAHREGPHGVRHWNRQVERLARRGDRRRPPVRWYVGRPLLVTTNDYALERLQRRDRRRRASAPTGGCAPGSPGRRGCATSRPAGSTRSRRCTR